MKNRKMVSFVVLLLIVSLSCNFLFPDNESHIPDLKGISQNAANLPLLDLEGPLPSPSAAQLRALFANEPGIASLIADVETAEQAAMQAAIADLQALLNPASNTQNFASLEASPFATLTFTMPPSARQSPAGDVSLVRYNQPGIIQQADGGLSTASIIGLLTSAFSDYFAIPEAMPTQSFSHTETSGHVTSNMSLEIGKSKDGSSHFGLGFKDEGTNNGIPVKTEMSAVIDGQRCPTAEGQVSFSVKARIGSESGGTGTTQDLTTFVRATVGDDAELTSTTLDIIQGTREVKNGRNVYVETGITYKFDYIGGSIASAESSNWREIRTSQEATSADITLVNNGNTAAVQLAMSSLASAMNTWQNGGCVKIVATSPGTVQPGSTTAIPVNVISKFDGSNAPSKLEAALTGGQSVDPTKLPKTPGTLTYTAPNENGKSATIILTAISRRGKAELELSANTSGAAYLIIGGLDDFQTSTTVCDIMKPFTLTGGGFALHFSGGLSGTYTYSGGPFNASGGGNYTISLPNGIGKPGAMTGSGVGCIESPDGKFCAGGTEKYNLTPLDPEASCSE